jgi:hypothetical protein
MKKLDDIHGGFDIEVGLAEYDYGYGVRNLELILKSKAVKVRVVAIIVNVFSLNKGNIMNNLGLINYIYINKNSNPKLIFVEFTSNMIYIK